MNPREHPGQNGADGFDTPRFALVFVDPRTRAVLERTTMRGARERVKAWAVGYARHLGDATFGMTEQGA